MALTQVRAKLGDVWTVLTYNEATGRYEGSITPPGTSAHQPGGYYNITVEASNATGQTATLDGAQYQGLRLVVRETAAPTLTLISPPEGWLTTAAPSFVFQAQDEAGGSGIDPDSAQAAIDGAAVPCTVTEANGVYTITLAASGLSEGPHLVTVSISDLDGNETTVSAAYQIDTVPPELYIAEPYFRHVTNDSVVLISGIVSDITSGIGSVTVSGTDVSVVSGRFEQSVFLCVGENNIPVVVTDGAGNQTTISVYMIRLITDREQADIDAIKALRNTPVALWTAEQRATWDAAVRRGSVDYWTANRVGITVDFLAGMLNQRGYNIDVSPKTDYTKNDYPTETAWRNYLSNVAKVSTSTKIPVTSLPTTLNNPTLDKFNRVEKALVDTDMLFPLMERSAIYSGEVFSGEW